MQRLCEVGSLKGASPRGFTLCWISVLWFEPSGNQKMIARNHGASAEGAHSVIPDQIQLESFTLRDLRQIPQLFKIRVLQDRTHRAGSFGEHAVDPLPAFRDQ